MGEDVPRGASARDVGVTSNGDVFGGTQICFGDVLGDQQVNFFASSIAQYRTFSLSMTNLSRRFQFALQGFSQTQFFYGSLEGVFYDPSLAPLIGRDQAIATRTTRAAPRSASIRSTVSGASSSRERRCG